MIADRPQTKTRQSAVARAAAIVLVALIAGLVIVAAWRSRVGDGTPSPIHSLAVLPIENLMGDAEQEYIVAAMHEALIGELGQIAALRTIPRTSVERYRKTAKSVPEIARELNVDALVEGSMFKSKDSVRVQLQLIRAAPVERQLWSRTFDGDLQDVLGLQKRVARAIAEEIRVTVTPEEAARLATARAVNPSAYDAWARGWFQFTKTTGESLRKCVDYASAAAAIDSSYAPAYALTATCYSTLLNIGSVAPHDVYPKIGVALRQALALDDGVADAHLALAWMLGCYDWDWSGAEREYRRGLGLNPSSTFGHGRFGWFLSWLGRFDEALPELKRAEQLNPADAKVMDVLSGALYVARRYDDAVVPARRATEVEPTYTFGFVRLGYAYSEVKRYDEAIAALDTAVRLSGDAVHKGVLGRAYALSGRRNEARRILEELLQLNRHEYVSPFHIALVYAALGENDQALHWLEEGTRVRDGNMVLLKVWPAWDSLRSLPRFQNLLQQMKFP